MKQIKIYLPIARSAYVNRHKGRRDFDRGMDWEIPAYSFEEFLELFEREKHSKFMHAVVPQPSLKDVLDVDLGVAWVLIDINGMYRTPDMSLSRLEEHRQLAMDDFAKHATLRNGRAFIPDHIINKLREILPNAENQAYSFQDNELKEAREKLKDKRFVEEGITVEKVEAAIPYKVQQPRTSAEIAADLPSSTEIKVGLVSKVFGAFAGKTP